MSKNEKKKNKKKEKEKEKEKEREGRKGHVVTDLSFWEKEEEKAKEKKSVLKNLLPLRVDESYEMENGFVGMKRDTILRLCATLWFKIDNVRIVFGMCEEFYQWIKRKYFSLKRPLYIDHALHSDDGKVFPSDEWGTLSSSHPLFLTHEITEGVFWWTVQMKNLGMYKKSFLQFGAIPVSTPFLAGLDDVATVEEAIAATRAASEAADAAADAAVPWEDYDYHDGVYASRHRAARDALGPRFDYDDFVGPLPTIPGGCFFRFGQNNSKPNPKNNMVTLVGAKDRTSGPSEKMTISADSLICLEIDANLRRLSFFAGDVRFPYGFSDVAFPVRLGIWSAHGDCVRSKTLIRIPSSPPAGVCKFYPCTPVHRK